MALLRDIGDDFKGDFRPIDELSVLILWTRVKKYGRGDRGRGREKVQKRGVFTIGYTKVSSLFHPESMFPLKIGS